MPNLARKLSLITLQNPNPSMSFPNFVYLHLVWFLKKQRVNSVWFTTFPFLKVGPWMMWFRQNLLAYPMLQLMMPFIPSEFWPCLFYGQNRYLEYIKSFSNHSYPTPRLLPFEDLLEGIILLWSLYADGLLKLLQNVWNSSAMKLITREKLHIVYILHLLVDFLLVPPFHDYVNNSIIYF